MRNEIKQYLKDHIYQFPLQLGSESIGGKMIWVNARLCGNVAITFIKSRNIFKIVCYCATNAGNYFYTCNRENFNK